MAESRVPRYRWALPIYFRSHIMAFGIQVMHYYVRQVRAKSVDFLLSVYLLRIWIHY